MDFNNISQGNQQQNSQNKYYPENPASWRIHFDADYTASLFLQVHTKYSIPFLPIDGTFFDTNQ